MKALAWIDEKNIRNVIYQPENEKEQAWKMDMKKIGIVHTVPSIGTLEDHVTVHYGWEDFVPSSQ